MSGFSRAARRDLWSDVPIPRPFRFIGLNISKHERQYRMLAARDTLLPNASLHSQFSIKAGSITRVTRRPWRVDLHDECIGVAVHEHALDLLHIAARRTFVPQLLT